MINFEEELKKFHPSLEVEDAEEAIYNQDLTDAADLLVKMMKEAEEKKRNKEGKHVCYNCGCHLSEHDFCTSCGADVSLYKRSCACPTVLQRWIGESGSTGSYGCDQQLTAEPEIQQNNIEARNLLGLVYFETGEVVAALSEWVISKICGPRKILRTIISICCSPMRPAWMPLTRRSKI